MLRSIRLTVDLIGQEERWKLVLLFVLIVAMALVQTVGVASILPFMNLVADPGEVDQNPILRWLYDNLRFTDTRQFLIFVGVAVLAITAFSNTFSAVTNWIMIRFLWNQHYRLSVRLLGKYLHEPYTFYLDHNSATLAKNILSEVKEALNGFVLPLMKGLAQAVVALSIVALLVWVDVMLALMSVVVLGGAYGLLYAIVRKKQIRFGQERLMANEARFRAANEAFGGIKELMVLGREKELLKRFAVPARTFSKVNTSNAILNEVPRYVLETVAFGGILLIVIYVLATREDIGQAIGVMSLYALAGYRLMPALQQVFAGFAKARFFDAAVENLHAELAGSGPARDNSPEAVPTEGWGLKRDIVFDNVSFRYPGSDLYSLRSVNLRIERNETIGLAGGTGSGKTTLVDILLGLLRPEEGSVLVDGRPLTGPLLHAWRRDIGYVPQHIYLLDDDVAQNIAFGLPRDDVDLDRVHQAARIAHLHDFVASLPKGYDTIVGERGVRLSGGQRQRIGIARALYHDPKILVMDEATSALDGITENSVMEAIRDLSGQKTIVLVAHRLVTLRDCDVIYLFETGTVLDTGTYDELIEQNAKFRAMARETQPAEGGVPAGPIRAPIHSRP
jgi:ATP-binding cassette, subfamily B, bacterial PglK